MNEPFRPQEKLGGSLPGPRDTGFSQLTADIFVFTVKNKQTQISFFLLRKHPRYLCFYWETPPDIFVFTEKQTNPDIFVFTEENKQTQISLFLPRKRKCTKSQFLNPV